MEKTTTTATTTAATTTLQRIKEETYQKTIERIYMNNYLLTLRYGNDQEIVDLFGEEILAIHKKNIALSEIKETKEKQRREDLRNERKKQNKIEREERHNEIKLRHEARLKEAMKDRNAFLEARRKEAREEEEQEELKKYFDALRIAHQEKNNDVADDE